LWRQGEARPTHRSEAAAARWWRTREDPFESVWPEILLWLQNQPDSTAKSLIERLQKQYPGRLSGDTNSDPLRPVLTATPSMLPCHRFLPPFSGPFSMFTSGSR
jgi:hypothetical protein